MNTIAPIIRPWLRTGLSVLLLSNEERVKEFMARDKAEREGNAQKASVPSDARGHHTSSSEQTGWEERVPSSPPMFQGSPPRQNLVSVKASPAPFSSSSPGFQKETERGYFPYGSSPFGILPESDWPDSWRILKSRRKLPTSPLVLWTYAGLGDDLVGAADPHRQQVMTRMLLALKHPGGTHVFWPYALPGEDCLQQPSLFWSGVARFDPRVILLFGSDTRDALSMPRSLLPLCQKRLYGRSVIQLPNPQTILKDEATFARVLAFLATSLRFCEKRHESL